MECVKRAPKGGQVPLREAMAVVAGHIVEGHVVIKVGNTLAALDII